MKKPKSKGPQGLPMKETTDWERPYRLQFDKELRHLRDDCGLEITDWDRAERCLNLVSPFHLEGFSIQWMDPAQKHFRKGTRFEDIFAVYRADRDLKDFLFDSLSEIEVQMRVVIGFVLQKRYGDFGYLKEENFRNEEFFTNFIHDVHNEWHRANEPYVAHYRDRYEDGCPIYMAVEIITFGSLSKLFSNMKRQDQKAVAAFYGIKSETVLASYFRALTTIRNTCAHHGRMMNRVFEDGCAILKSDQALVEQLDPGFRIHSDRLFAAIVAICHLLPKIRQDQLLENFTELFQTYSQYDPYFLNFPPHWREMLDQI